MTKDVNVSWDLEEEVERLRETLENYRDLLEGIVDAYEYSSFDLEELDEIDLADALDKARDYYQNEG